MQISAILKSKGPSVATIGRDPTVAAAVAELTRHKSVPWSFRATVGRLRESSPRATSHTPLTGSEAQILDKPVHMIMSKRGPNHCC